jgi:hypothetical protein
VTSSNRLIEGRQAADLCGNYLDESTRELELCEASYTRSHADLVDCTSHPPGRK